MELGGSLEDIFDTAYGHLLLVKIALFVAMVAVAAINRFRLSTPACRSRVRSSCLNATVLSKQRLAFSLS